jgi:hypothetical protein
MYVIMGATGNIGSKLANILLDKGEPIRVIGRSAKRLQSFITREVFANYFAQVYHQLGLDYGQSFSEDLEKRVEDVGLSEDVSRLLDGMPELYTSDLLGDSLHRVSVYPRM